MRTTRLTWPVSTSTWSWPAHPDGNPLEGVLPEEMAGLGAMAHFRDHETGYQEIQKTRPQTLSLRSDRLPRRVGRMDPRKVPSVDRLRWRSLLGHLTLDELCTNIMIYWVTGTINSSTRLYFETLGPGRATAMPRVEVPTGCAVFPKEIYQSPRSWADKQYNVTHWSRFDKGGHFAAMEQPDALVGDIRAFARTLR